MEMLTMTMVASDFAGNTDARGEEACSSGSHILMLMLMHTLTFHFFPVELLSSKCVVVDFVAAMSVSLGNVLL